MASVYVGTKMAQQKKDAGNRVLERLGVSRSVAINGLYDYIIRHGELPFTLEEEFGMQKYTDEQRAAAAGFVEALERAARDGREDAR